MGDLRLFERFIAGILLICGSGAAQAGDSCLCPPSADLPKPAPSFKELKLTTAHLKSLDHFKDELLGDKSLASDAARTARFEACFKGGFADVAKFVQIKDITEVSYDAYVPYMESFFLRHDYGVSDVMEVVQDLAVYKDLELQRKSSPYARAHEQPKIVGVRPCEWSKLTDHKDDGKSSVNGYYDEQKNIAYYNSCLPLKDAVTNIVHELTHSATRTQELDEMHTAFRSVGGRIGQMFTKGPGGAVANRNQLRYDEEYRGYVGGVRADRELVRTYPGLDAGVSEESCGDTAEWVDFWQKFEDINGAGGYPKKLTQAELEKLRRDMNCPAPSN